MCLATLFLMILGISPAHAGETSPDPTHDLDAMVVAATRSPMDASQITANITVITAEEIEKLPAVNVAEVLQYVPDLHVEFNGGPGSEASAIRIQGSESRQVTIYQDGVPLNMLANPQTNLSYLSIGAVDRIEVYKGAASSAWGSALGGVINIITKSPDRNRPVSAGVRASYGEYQTVKARASLDGSKARVGYFVSGTHEQSDGFMDHTDYEHTAAYAKLNYDVGKTSRVNFLASYDQGRNTDPLPVYAEFWDDIEQERFYQRLLFETAPSDRLVLTLEGRHHRFQSRIEDVFANRRELYNDYTDETWGASARLRWEPMAANVLIGGFDGDWGEYDWNRYTQIYDTGYWAAYMNDTHTIGQVTVNLGLRHDRNQDFGSATSPSAGISWHLFQKKARLRAQVARGFSAPPAAWVHDPTYGNPDLDPETAINYQLGGNLRLFEGLDLSVNLFRADVEEMISFDCDLVRYENIDQVTRKGGAWSAAWKSPWELTLSVAGSHVKATDDRTGNTIQDIPRHTYKLSAHYIHHFLSHTLLGRYIDHNSSFPETRDKTFIFDYRLRVDLPLAKKHGRWDLFFNVYNLFDSDYLYREVWPKPGRWVEGGVALAY